MPPGSSPSLSGFSRHDLSWLFMCLLRHTYRTQPSKPRGRTWPLPSGSSLLSRSTCPSRISPRPWGWHPLPSLPSLDGSNKTSRKKKACFEKQEWLWLESSSLPCSLSHCFHDWFISPILIEVKFYLWATYLFFQNGTSVRRLWSQFQLFRRWSHCFDPGVLMSLLTILF